MKLLARWLAEQLSKTHQSCVQSLITHDVFVVSCSSLNSYCQDNQFAVWRRRTWTAPNNEHYTKIIRERITWIFCLNRELQRIWMRMEGRWIERTHETMHKRFYKINITKYFRICGRSEILTDMEGAQRVLWEHGPRPEIRRTQNNHISICFVLELKRTHSTTTLYVTMLTRPLSHISVEKLIRKNHHGLNNNLYSR